MGTRKYIVSIHGTYTAQTNITHRRSFLTPRPTPAKVTRIRIIKHVPWVVSCTNTGTTKNKAPIFQHHKDSNKNRRPHHKVTKKMFDTFFLLSTLLWYVRCVSLMKQAWTRWNVRAKTRKTTLAPIMQHMFCYLREHTLPTRAQSISLQLFNKQSTTSNVKNKVENQLWFLARHRTSTPFFYPQKKMPSKNL